MAQSRMETETFAHALAQTQRLDERDAEYWLPLINASGWIVSLQDEHNIGQRLPYAVAVIDVKHTVGVDRFVGHTILGRPVIVFADELRPSSSTTGRQRSPPPPPPPRNRQSDGNTYIYQLHGLQQYIPHDTNDFAALPTGRYKLEIMIPLFRMEAIVSISGNESEYRVSAAAGFVYDSRELEEGSMFMGIVRRGRGRRRRRSTAIDAPKRGFVWKLLKDDAASMREFENEMHSRTWVFRVGVGDADDHLRQPQEQRRRSELASPEEVVEHLRVDFEGNGAGPDVANPERRLHARDMPALSSDFSEDEAIIKSEPETDTECKPLIVMPKSKKRGCSRHDPGELWVHRGGKRMKF